MNARTVALPKLMRSRPASRGRFGLAISWIFLAGFGCAQTLPGTVGETVLRGQIPSEPSAQQLTVSALPAEEEPALRLEIAPAGFQEEAQSRNSAPPIVLPPLAPVPRPPSVPLAGKQAGPREAFTQANPQQGPPPRMVPASAKDYDQFVIKTIQPEAALDLIVGLPKILVFKEAPKRVQMDGDDKGGVAAYTVVTEKELSVVGKKPGRTVLNLWFADPKEAGKDRVLSYLVRVFADPQASLRVREQLEKYYRELELEINRAFPDSLVCLQIVGNKLLLGGQARDIAEATQIMRIVTPRGTGGRAAGATIVEHGLAQTKIQRLPEDFPDILKDQREDSDGVNPYFQGGLQVINMLRVPGEQQVELHVVVAEVNRTAARNLGLNYSFKNGQGLTVVSNTTGSGVQASTTGAGGTGTLLNSSANLPILLDNGKIALAITALKNRNLARTLAEPTVVALNGQTASFSAGGEFPVPVVTGFTAAGLQGVSFVPFGVQLKFKPTITDKDRVRLNISGDISSINAQGSANVGGTNVPGLNSRTFNTTVELREGQTMAMAGLIQSNYLVNSTRIPFLGDIPLIGRLFGGSDQTASGEQELIVLITPVLVHPLDPHHTQPIPGADMLEPTDAEFYLGGHLESHRPVDYRTPVRTDLQRMHQYREELPNRQENPNRQEVQYQH